MDSFHKSFLDACECGTAEIIKVFATHQHGLDVDIQDEFGDTGLIRATLGSKVDIVNTLIELNADCTLRNIANQTAFDIARILRRTEIANVLQRQGPRDIVEKVRAEGFLTYGGFLEYNNNNIDIHN